MLGDLLIGGGGEVIFVDAPVRDEVGEDGSHQNIHPGKCGDGAVKNGAFCTIDKLVLATIS